MPRARHLGRLGKRACKQQRCFLRHGLALPLALPSYKSPSPPLLLSPSHEKLCGSSCAEPCCEPYPSQVACFAPVRLRPFTLSLPSCRRCHIVMPISRPRTVRLRPSLLALPPDLWNTLSPLTNAYHALPRSVLLTTPRLVPLAPGAHVHTLQGHHIH